MYFNEKQAIRLFVITFIVFVLSACATKQAKQELKHVPTETQVKVQLEYQQFQDALALIQAEKVTEKDQLKAQAIFDALYESNESYLGALVNSADISYALEQFDKAKSSYLKVIEAVQTPKIKQNLELQDTVSATKKISENTPLFLSHSYNQLGLIARKEGQFEKAEAYYRDALKLDTENTSVIKNLAILLDLYRGKLPEALSLYEQYQTLQGEKDPQVKDWIYDLKNRLPSEEAQ